VDRLFGIYAAVTGLAFAFPFRPAAWPLLAAVHLVAAALGLGIAPVRRVWDRFALRFPRAAVLVGDWYPLVLLPAIYMELALLNRAVFGGRYFDDLIIGWEQALFRGQPSRTFAPAAPFRWLSEMLHSAYLSYYLIVMVPPIILAAQRRWTVFREAVFTLMLAFFAHYLFFVFFPVQGPRYLFAPPGSGQAEGPAFRLAHDVLEAGSSQGSAFPSSHVGVSVAQSANALRFLKRLAPALIVLTLGLAAGAVYGGFHYAIDAVAGMALGTACAVIGPTLYRRLLPSESQAPASSLVVAR
jgi:membrane-associated phospholipid phosphatase